MREIQFLSEAISVGQGKQLASLEYKRIFILPNRIFLTAKLLQLTSPVLCWISASYFWNQLTGLKIFCQQRLGAGTLFHPLISGYEAAIYFSCTYYSSLVPSSSKQNLRCSEEIQSALSFILIMKLVRNMSFFLLILSTLNCALPLSLVVAEFHGASVSL